MELCKKCFKEKVREDFYTNKTSANGLTSYCKQCMKDRTNIPYKNDPDFRQRIKKKSLEYRHLHLEERRAYEKKLRESWKDGKHHVYIIDNYAGVTNSPLKRKREHGTVGRNKDTFRIVYSTKSRSDALELEALLHDMGYEGKHRNNTYK